MTTPTPEAIEAALDAVRAIDGPASIGSEEVVTAALSAAAPFVAAKAKGEALREAAEHLMAHMTEPSGEAYRILHELAATIEGKSE